jgi:hypothetical protein
MLLQIRAFQSGSNAIKAGEEQMGFGRRAAFLFLDEPEGICYFYQGITFIGGRLMPHTLLPYRGICSLIGREGGRRKREKRH